MRGNVYRQPIAIIGMAGRFPGASNPAELWRNVLGGVESIRRFRDEELLAAGVESSLLQHPNYVKSAPVLEHFDCFDAAFFTIPPPQAEAMDPQHRIFLELCWEALESAGLAGAAERSSIGVFASAGGLLSSYLVSRYHFNARLAGDTAGVEQIGNDKDFLATRVSYRLNLRGPAYTVQCGCSSSLAAVHLACQSLLHGESDAALAGGVSVRVPHLAGYLYEEDGILSPDGHCRPFDMRAQGTIFGSGAGVVVLKPLDRAISDRDPIVAVIRGSAVNNDGGEKISYWSTAAERQADCMRRALANADVPPGTVGLVEAHGTATALGDIAEAAALRMAYGVRATAAQGVLGSVKANFGHLEAAAGIAGLIKAALALRHRVLPATLHFQNPNPKIGFDTAPFRPLGANAEWLPGESPRRAAVNSLGIGGTNVHVILEEALPPERRPEASTPRLVALSARTPAALRTLASRWAEALSAPCAPSLADAAFTANYGRRHFEYRAAIVASTREEAVARLQEIARAADAPYSEPHDTPLEGGDSEEILRHFLNGGPIPAIPPDGRKSELPAYPFERRRYWIEPEPIRPPAAHPLLGQRLDLAGSDEFRWESRITPHQPAYLDQHRVYGKVVVLGVCYFEAALAAGREIFGSSGLALDNVTIERALILEDGEKRAVQLSARRNGERADFEIFSRVPGSWVRHAYGSVRPSSTPSSAPNLAELQREVRTEVPRDDYYSRLAVYYGPLLRNLEQLRIESDVALGRVAIPASCAVENIYVVHPALLDACLQPVFAILYRNHPSADAYVPLGVGRLAVYQPAPAVAWTHVRIRAAHSSSDAHTFDVAIFSENGDLICELESLQLIRAPRTSLGAADESAGLLYKIDWEPVSAPALDQVARACRELATSDKAATGALTGLLERLSAAWAGVAARHANGVAPRHRSCLARLREFATPGVDAAVLERELATGYPEATAELALIGRCGRSLQAVLAGKTDPLDVLFPNADDSDIARLNSSSPSFLPGVNVLKSAVEKLAAGRRGLRILEVGGGTGSATAAVLPLLRGAVSRYVFSDITPAFLSRARERFAEYPEMEYRTLDLERDPASQGFQPSSFDVVIAANVLHATAGIRETLQRIHSLLSPGGTLVLLEGTAQRAWIDLIFGLTSGWWKFEADPDRHGYPLLTSGQWTEILRQCGFASPQAIDTSSGDDPFPQAVLLAEAVLPDPCASEVVCTSTEGWKAGLAATHHLQRRSDTARGLSFASVGAMPADGSTANPDAALLWGLGRVVQLEHPEWNCRLIDSDSSDEAPALRRNPDETLLAIRNGRLFAPRLDRLRSASSGSIGFRRDGTCLITGGFGGLGLLVARWMAERGAGRLVLIGRHAPNAAARDMLAAIRQAGTEVIAAQCDVVSKDDLRSLVEPFVPSLRVVVHAAGVLSDAALANQTEDRFERVLAPKVRGAWNLHGVTAAAPVDYFVLFSSVAGVLGSRGQANHAAANAFLDSFAWWRRGRGLPALSIDWGPWAESGAAADPQILKHWDARGVQPMSSRQGLAALEAAMLSGETQVLAAAIDWKRFDNSESPLYRRMSQEPVVPPSRPAPVPHPGSADSQSAIREILLDLLGLDPSTIVDPRRGFVDLGLDSLAAVEFRNRLQTLVGRPLPATLAFDYPTLESLTAHLASAAVSAPRANGFPAPHATPTVRENSVEDDLARTLERLGY